MALKLEQLFAHREQQFRRNTERILTSMKNVIDGVVQFLNLNEELAQGQLTWQDVQFRDEIVMLIGFIDYPPGAKFATSNGEVVVVSEQTVDYFRRIIRMGLPADLVHKNSADDTIAFLQEIQKQNEIEEVEMIELPVPDGVEDFDLDSLTDEQKAALVVRKTAPGSVH